MKDCITGHYIQVDAYWAHYDTIGEGKPVVLLPMAGASSLEYRWVLEYFRGKRYQVIALDPPGHGGTYPDMRDLSIADTADKYVDFVWHFVQALGLQRPAFVGSAMSGSMVLLLAAKYGEKVGVVVAGGANTEFRGGVAKEIDWGFLDHPSVNMADFKEANTPSLCGKHVSVERINECIWNNARNASPQVIETDLKIYNEFSVEEQIQNICCPVLHLIGDSDCTVRRESIAFLQERLPGTELKILPGTGHFANIENPEGFAEAVEEFLNRRYK